MNRITILNAKPKKLTKEFSLVDNKLVKKDYDKAYKCWYEYKECNSIEGIYALLMELKDEPYKCVIRGELVNGIDTSKPVLRRKRAKGNDIAYFTEKPDGNNWAMIDFDKVPIPDDLPFDLDYYLEYLISLLPDYLHDCSYVYQWSSSAGVGKWLDLRCHIWFWLEAPLTDTELGNWAKSLNTEDFKLVDDSVFRTVQPNYTASPIFNKGTTDPLGDKRIGLVKKKYSTAIIPIVEKKKPPLPQSGYSYSPTTGNIKTKFDERLEQIGRPDYHISIVKAVGSWKAQTCPNSDISALKARLVAAIVAAPGGGSMGKPFYCSNEYLDQVIESCDFAGEVGFARRMPETDKERMAWMLSKKTVIDANDANAEVADFIQKGTIKRRGNE